MKDIVQISTGGDHTCALKNNGKVLCWGSNNSGQLGIGLNISTQTSYPYPVEVIDDYSKPIALSEVIRIVSGTSHTCALTTQKEVKCWGGGRTYAFIVSGKNDNFSSIETEQPNLGPLGDVVDIISGDQKICALISNGRMKCWDQHWNLTEVPYYILGKTGPIDIDTYQRSMSCIQGVGCSLDGLLLSFSGSGGTIDANTSPTIVVSGVDEGGSISIYNDSECGNLVGNLTSDGEVKCGPTYRSRIL